MNISSKFKKYKSFLVIILSIIYLTFYVYNNWNQNISVKENSQNILENKQNNNLNLDSKIYKLYEEKFKVTKIIDGDTIHVRKILVDGSLENFTYKIRMMVVNTLEKNSLDVREKCLANLGSQFTYKNLMNKNVYLFGDKTQPKLDQYDRTLAYVLEENANIFYNEILMNSGLAKTYKASPPATEWRKYENIKLEMEKQNKGIWDLEVCKI